MFPSQVLVYREYEGEDSREKKKKSGLNRDVVLGREFTEVEILSGKFWREKKWS